jgi:hypothetical protein
LAEDDRANLICLKLRDGDPIYFLIVETATRGGGLLEPAIDGIPSNSLYPSNRGLVQSLDAESGNLIESLCDGVGVGGRACRNWSRKFSRKCRNDIAGASPTWFCRIRGG